MEKIIDHRACFTKIISILERMGKNFSFKNPVSNSAFNSDPVSVPLRRLSIGCNPNPEIKISSFLILHSPRYQQEEQVFIKTNTLRSPPPVLMILQ